MRILSFFFSALIFFTVVGVIGALVIREVLLTKAVWQVRDSVRSMREIATKGNSYVIECQKRGALDLAESAISMVQLRFTSATEYNVEVMCSNFSFDPIIVKTESLPWAVRKKPGASGIIWGDLRSGVALEIYGRSRGVVVEEQEIEIIGTTNADLGSGPRTVCAGYGSQCCSQEVSAGVGEQNGSALDCPRTCYQQCQARPVVLTLTTLPFLNQQTREVQVGPDEVVEFNYVASAGSSPDVTAKFDFGDGEQTEFTGLNNKATHSFNCNQPECTYQVSLTLVDKANIESFATPITRVTVKVSEAFARVGEEWDTPNRY